MDHNFCVEIGLECGGPYDAERPAQTSWIRTMVSAQSMRPMQLAQLQSCEVVHMYLCLALLEGVGEYC